MPKHKQIDFSSALVLLDKDKLKLEDIKTTHETQDYQLHMDSNIYLVKSKIADGFLWIYARNGDTNMYSNEVYNTNSKQIENNPKHKHHAELLHQIFAVFDFKHNKLYINNQKKVKFLAKYIKELTNKDCKIVKEIGSSQDVIDKINRLTSLKLTMVDDLFRKDLLSPNVSMLLESSSTMSIDLVYDIDIKNNKGLFGALKNLIDQSKHYKKIVIKGLDEDEDENIYNLDVLTVKRSIKCSFNDDKFDPDEVMLNIIKSLNREKNVQTS